MKITVAILALGALSGVMLGQLGELKPIPSARMDRAIPALTPIGRMLIPAREILVEGTYPDGKPLLGNLLIRFDPSTGYFLLDCSIYIAPFEYRGIEGRLPPHKLSMIDGRQKYPGSTVVYADKDSLTAFDAVVNRILIREATQKANSLDDAENKAFRQALNQLGILEHDGAYGFQRVSLWEKLGRDFFAPKDSVLIGGFSFLDVVRKDGGWDILLKGQWKEQLTLDDKYEVVKLAPVK